MQLAMLALQAMLSVTPAEYRPDEALTQKLITYETIASEIAESVRTADELPFEGPSAQEATVLALVSIAAEESTFDPKVRDCRRKGDHGASISVFQLLHGPGWGKHTEKEICKDPILAGRLAIDVLGWYRRERSDQRLFNGYATGRADKTNYAAQVQGRVFRRLLSENQISLGPKKGYARLLAESTAPPSEDGLATN